MVCSTHGSSILCSRTQGLDSAACSHHSGLAYPVFEPLGSYSLHPFGHSGQVLSTSEMGLDRVASVVHCAPHGLLSSQWCQCVPVPPRAPQGPGSGATHTNSLCHHLVLRTMQGRKAGEPCLCPHGPSVTKAVSCHVHTDWVGSAREEGASQVRPERVGK